MTAFHLNNRTILVTGASSGIGRQIAVSVCEMGGNVVITGRDQKRLDETDALLKSGKNKGSSEKSVGRFTDQREFEALSCRNRRKRRQVESKECCCSSEVVW
ncbi:MAG: SDR family NAD(P)-dependent oxidoreductase [Burkholderiales bacterium]